MKYLVTGGAGFIGSNIVETLVHHGERVRVIDNFSTGYRENLSNVESKIEIIEGDIRSYHTVRDAVDGMDFVLHQAALGSVPRSIDDPITTNDVNANGTLNLLDVAKDANIKRFVFASSSSIYGDSLALPKNEQMIPSPISPYAVSKLSAEKYSYVFNKVYGLETVVLRYFNVFGPKQSPKGAYAAIIPLFIQAMLENRAPTIYGDGKTSRDFTFVRDVVEANLVACVRENIQGKVFNIAGSSQTSLNELAKIIVEETGYSGEITYEEERKGDVRHSRADIEEARKHLGFGPKMTLRKGIQKIVQFEKLKRKETQ